MKKYLILLITGLIGSVINVSGQERFEHKDYQFVDDEGDSVELSYSLYVPDCDDPTQEFPLFIVHSVTNEVAEQLLSALNEANIEAFIIRTEVDLYDEELLPLLSPYPIDPARIYFINKASGGVSDFYAASLIYLPEEAMNMCIVTVMNMDAVSMDSRSLPIDIDAGMSAPERDAILAELLNPDEPQYDIMIRNSSQIQFYPPILYWITSQLKQ